MKMVKRWGVMTLVAVLVLGTMGAARADDALETESETAKEPLESDSYAPALDWVDGLVQFVFYWGSEGKTPECDDSEESVPSTDSGTFGLGGWLPVTVGVPAACVPLNEKNGHFNHGSMVSSFVHWLKDGNLEDLVEADPGLVLSKLQDMPKGQLVKMFAHDDFGKGNFELPDPDDPAAADVEGVESDRHGPPEWVKDRKAEKAADKAAKGKNK